MNLWEITFFNNISGYIAILNKLLGDTFIPQPLSNHIKILGGYAFKSSEYTGSGVPVIRISDFQNEKVVLDKVRYYKESSDLSRYELFENDIIIAMTGGTIGKLAIVQKKLGKIYLNQRVGKFSVINPDEFEPEYIYWIARGIQENIKNLAWGGAQPNVSGKVIESMEIPFPDKATQKNIISFLRDLRDNSLKDTAYFDEYCEKEICAIHSTNMNCSGLSSEITHQQSLLKKLRQQILQDAISGKLTTKWRALRQAQGTATEPASELLARIKAEKERLVKEKKIKKQKPLPAISDDEIPFELPDGWVWCRLGDVSENYDGLRKPISRTERERREKVYEYYGASGVIDKIDNYTHDGMFLLIGEDGANLVSRSTPVAFVVKGKFWVNNHAHTLGFLNSSLLKYIEFHINGISLIPYISGGFQPKLSQSNLNNISIALPPEVELKNILDKVERIFKTCEQLEAQSTKSQQEADLLMSAVLKEAFEG